jgi:aryl-alcohol dehydrogenase-like predicted oxidoreductase
MEKITLAGLEGDASVLGFGAASLGSRIGARAGRDLLTQAVERGITWFDLAPAYGAGQAEEIFAAALSSQRDRVQICTKVGLLPPPQPVWKRALMPVARQVISIAKPLRARVRRSGVTSNRAIPLTPELLRESLERSLTRLKTDYVDVYALHNATPEALGDEAILRTLEDIRTSGKARAIAVASDEAAARAALETGAPFGVVQIALSDASADLVTQAGKAGMGLITHSVFGVDGALAQAEARMAADPSLRTKLQDTGLASPADALMLQARLRNPAGVTLCSMMSPARLEANVAAFETTYGPQASAVTQELFAPA